MKCSLCFWEGSDLTQHILEAHAKGSESPQAKIEVKEVPPMVGRKVAHHMVADKYGTIISTRRTPGAFRETEVLVRWDPKWEEEPEWWDLGNVALLPSQPEAGAILMGAKQEEVCPRCGKIAFFAGVCKACGYAPWPPPPPVPYEVSAWVTKPGDLEKVLKEMDLGDVARYKFRLYEREWPGQIVKSRGLIRGVYQEYYTALTGVTRSVFREEGKVMSSDVPVAFPTGYEIRPFFHPEYRFACEYRGPEETRFRGAYSNSPDAYYIAERVMALYPEREFWVFKRIRR